ncbi:MAG: hypothetical protein AB9903_16670 [Vulcanimicrobiota bacterium]
MDKIGGIGGSIGGEQNQKIRETLRDRADQMIQKTSAAGDGDASSISTLDANKVSEEAMEQLSGSDDKGSADVDSILKSILDMKSQDRNAEEDAGEADAAEEGAPAQKVQDTQAAGDKKQVEEVKVEWQPMVKEGDTVETGQPWGHFTVTREKKDADNKKDAGGNDGAAAAQAAPQKASKNGKNGAASGLLKGQDGKTPVTTKGANPLEDPAKKGAEDKGATWKVGEGGKPCVIDQGTGEKMEIPDSGELKATHPMKITNIGKTGELKGGDELFTYQKPTDEEVEKSKKAREQGKDVKEIDETKAQAQGDNDMKK